MDQSERITLLRASAAMRQRAASAPLPHFLLPILLLLSWPLGGIHAQTPVTPQPRRHAAGIQLENKWYIQGGYYAGYLNSFISLDLSSDWSADSPPWSILPNGLIGSHFALVATKDGRIWSVGGNQKTSLFSVYNPSTNAAWRALPDAVPSYPQGISGHAALVVPGDDRIFIIGGAANISTIPHIGPNVIPNLITVFDTVKNRFVAPGPAQAEPGYTSWVDMACAWLEKKKVMYFFGGTRNLPGDVGRDIPLDSLRQFLPLKSEWSDVITTGTRPPARFDHCMAANADGSKVVVFGGSDGTQYLSDIYILNTETNEWTQGPSASQPRMRMVCTIRSNQLIAWGGSYGAKAPETIHSPEPLIYNLYTNTWVTTFAASLSPPSNNNGNNNNNNNDSNNQSGQSSTPVGAIIGGVVGGVAVILAVVGLLFFRRSRQRRRKESVAMITRDGRNDNPHSSSSASLTPWNAPLLDEGPSSPSPPSPLPPSPLPPSSFPPSSCTPPPPSFPPPPSSPPSSSPPPSLPSSSPQINRATRPTPSPTLTNLDTVASFSPSIGSASPSTLVGSDRFGGAGKGGRQWSFISASSGSGASQSPSSPQFTPPNPSRVSQWRGSPQDYDGGQSPVIHTWRSEGAGGAQHGGLVGVRASLFSNRPKRNPQAILSGILKSDKIPPPATT